MARNPRWNLPLGDWRQVFSDWIRTPEPRALMNASIFFDFRPVYGHVDLAFELRDSIFADIDKQPLFLNLLAANALENPPPLGFLGNLLLETGGDHKNEFDLKARGMMPLADAARVLTYERRLSAVGTLERFDALAELADGPGAVAAEAAFAYGWMMALRGRQGLAHCDSGRFVDPAALSSLERKSLKLAFAAIGEMQTVLRARFQLDLLRG